MEGSGPPQGGWEIGSILMKILVFLQCSLLAERWAKGGISLRGAETRPTVVSIANESDQVT